ncbi:MAG TPA: fluoride efflux transporter CrcB [Acidimicrobiales bacterium]|nr:fluoride efflux transporter CrcB [Acidimicrobiales bacterium]
MTGLSGWAGWAGLAVAGMIGAPCRYLLDGWVGRRTAGPFPWGTLVVNVSGSLLLGLVAGAALYHGFPNTPRVWLGSGFCGAYTTFSTFAFETVRLVEEGLPAAALRYVALSLMAGTAAAAVGLALAAL